MSERSGSLPEAARPIEQVSRHWLLARLDKQVLRPGGVELSRWPVAVAGVSHAEAGDTELVAHMTDVVVASPGELERFLVILSTDGNVAQCSPRSVLGGFHYASPAPVRSDRHLPR